MSIFRRECWSHSYRAQTGDNYGVLEFGFSNCRLEGNMFHLNTVVVKKATSCKVVLKF